ncbi:MAG: hypothetical protein U9Q34_05135 [Elusimicrobiota bacterium]|nr:hypothetical protein [Elusimicrobiota bacterium]
MQNKIHRFSEFDDFYSFFKPLTPLGKIAKEKMDLFTDIKTLENEYSLIADFLDLIKKNRILFDRIENHLIKTPLLSFDYGQDFRISDVFLLKKFLSHSKAVFSLLPKQLRQKLNMKWASMPLLTLLMKGGAGETFYISDSYNPQLKTTRNEILKIAGKLKNIKKTTLKKLALQGLDFSTRDFLIIDTKSGYKHYNNRDLFVEAYDSENIMVKPVFGEKFLKLSAAKEILNKKEKNLENEIIKEIAVLAKKSIKKLIEISKLIEKTDLLIAKARLAAKFDMIKPILTKSAGIIFKKARFIPIKLKLKKMKLKYRPLSASFGKRINSLRGSNMGGKTVALKTAAFFQILAQMGFFVPAQYYQTQVFKRISFAGNLSDEDINGLSGFGLEMQGFIDSGDLKEKSLIFMDEFAKTTNSNEATALLTAIIEIFSQNPNAFMFISTHFSGLPENKNAACLKMKGFDNAAFKKHFKSAASSGEETSLIEKLIMINKFMRYEIVPDDNKKRIRDAIKIAKILGMDPKIIKLAKKKMEKKTWLNPN